MNWLNRLLIMRSRYIRNFDILHSGSFIYHRFDLLYDEIISMKLRLSIEKAFCIGGSRNKPQHNNIIFR